MKIIGLTGSIAMGKSEVARIIAENGVAVLDSDAVVHAIYEQGEGAQVLAAEFPSSIVDGKVDRRKLSAIVLADPAKFQRLEDLIHPLVRARQTAFLAAQQDAGARLAVLDIPLLFETNELSRFDSIIVVSAPAERQREWALRREGMTEEKLRKILARQLPDSEKRRRATHVIENDGSLADLEEKTKAVLHEIRQEWGVE